MSTIVSTPLETEETRPISSEQAMEEDLRERCRERRVLVCYQQPTWASKQRD